jgi:hypothetical protein
MFRSFSNLIRWRKLRPGVLGAAWLTKILSRLLSASLETCFRRNFGRRYFRTVAGSLLFCILYCKLVPAEARLIQAFLFVFFAMVIYQVAYYAARRQIGGAEPHSYWPGDSWAMWEQFGIHQTIVRRYIEPGLCFLFAWLSFGFDPYFSAWVGAGGFSIFAKEQIIRLDRIRRALEMIDSRIESQETRSSVEEFLSPRHRERERGHRPHLPVNRPTRRGDQR